MAMETRKTRRRKVAVASVVAALTVAGSASAAFQALPPGDQVNHDQAAGINPNLLVNTEDPANSDVVGGSLVATKPLVPWAIFRQTEPSPNKDQVFSRSFAGGVWTTRGNGTVGGSSDSGPTHLFSGSLNFDQTTDGEAPSIDFAGPGRTVPWASWYEGTSGVPNFGGADNIFASKFDATQNKWIFAGQGRGNGGASSVPVPSLNIHTNRNAVNPVVQGGATVAGNDPVPWVTWQEVDGNTTTSPQQIFTSKAVKPTSGTTCPNDGANPPKPTPTTGAEGGFCFQQVGVERVASGATSQLPNTTDPSLNVDPTRDGVEPDMAFTGSSDTVPWVVWYEQSNGTTPHNSTIGLRNNEMVFAAKATPPGTPPPTGTVDGGFNWTAVGRTGTPGFGVLDISTHGPNSFGPCAQDVNTEASCSLNADPTKDAEDPSVAAGTMTAGNPTVPWVVWDEGSATTPNNNSIVVARLVGTGATARFVIANNGQPVGTGDRADITFSGNTPYITWHRNNQVVTGHFTTPDAFVKDGTIASNAPDTVRAPISSGCIADPFNADGSSCQAGAVGTPFFLFTDSVSGIAKLFATAYQADNLVTGPATAISTSGATLNGSVNPEGAAVNVQFQFGTTTAYGSQTAQQKIGVSNSSQSFSASIGGLPPGTTIHYRAVATSDFAPPVVGGDQTFKTLKPPGPGHTTVGKAKVSGTSAFVLVKCTGATGATCKLRFRMTITEKRRGNKIIAITARKKPKPKVRKIIVTVGSAPGITLSAGRSKTVKVSLNGLGKRLLASRHTLKVTLDVTQVLSASRSQTLSQTVTFKAKKTKKKHHR